MRRWRRRSLKPSPAAAPPVQLASGAGTVRTNAQSDPTIPGSRVGDPVAIEPEAGGDSFEDSGAAPVALPQQSLGTVARTDEVARAETSICRLSKGISAQVRS